jgi:hypothetical protein
MAASVPDDIGVGPTNTPDVRLLWERFGGEVVLTTVRFPVEVDDPPPVTIFDPPPGLQEWWEQQKRSGAALVIETDWTDQ